MTGYPCCCKSTVEPCLFCLAGTTPKQLQLELPEPNNYNCLGCTSYGGSYILDSDSDIGDTSLPFYVENPCHFRYDHKLDLGSALSTGYTSRCSTEQSRYVIANLYHAGSTSGTTWEAIIGYSVYYAVFRKEFGSTDHITCSSSYELKFKSAIGYTLCRWTTNHTVVLTPLF